MRKYNLLILVAVALAAVFFFSRFKIEGLNSLRFAPVDASGEGGDPARRGEGLRIASFNIQVFGTSKLDKPKVANTLAKIVREFDIVAIQEVRSNEQDLIPRFVEMVNQTGRKYDYVIGPRVGRTNDKEQFAFLFDRESVEVDRTQLYTIDDPYDRISHEPLVAWFRVRGPAQDKAFTFSLVNVHVDPNDAANEIAVLHEIYRVVRDDGRREDDVILAGDFQADAETLAQSIGFSGITWAVSSGTTDTRSTKLTDNLVFASGATIEYVGRQGTFDFMRKYNMTLEQALEVSDHLPVWAEFSVYEGGQPGRVADRATPAESQPPAAIDR